jgi:dTMP kinase
MKRGKFIVIEGIDASGKTTQYNLLKGKLKGIKLRSITADFPRYYKSKWGKLVGRYLEGEFGELDEINPHLTVLPYMIDQYTWSRDIGAPWLNKGGWILSNRYFTSNVHQIAKLRAKAQKEFRNWIWPLGYKELGMLKPDLVIFIDTAPSVTMKLNKEKEDRKYLRGKREDIAEDHWGHQKAAYEEYKRTVKMNNWWVSVPGIRDAKKDFSAEIHNNLWNLVRKRLIL